MTNGKNEQAELEFSRLVAREDERSDHSSQETLIYRGAEHPSQLVDDLVYPHIETCWDIFKWGTSKGVKRRCFGARKVGENHQLQEFQWLTYEQVAQQAVAFGLGVRKLGLISGLPTRELFGASGCIGVYCKNRIEWAITEQAANISAFVLVPLYSSLGIPALRHILQETGLSVVVVAEESVSSLVNVYEECAQDTRFPEDPTNETAPGVLLKHIVLLPQYSCIADCAMNNARVTPTTNSSSVGRRTADSSMRRGIDETAIDMPTRMRNDDCHEDALELCAACTMTARAADIMDDVKKAWSLGLSVYTWNNILEAGYREAYDRTKVSASIAEKRASKVVEQSSTFAIDDVISEATKTTLQTICYTSGTTGRPKGVMITHRNLVAMVCAGYRGVFAKLNVDITEDDCHISYLPLAHILERVMINIAISMGVRVGFYHGETQKLIEDILLLKPTILVSVPRGFNRIYNTIIKNIRTLPAPVQKVFDYALNYKVDRYRVDAHRVSHMIWDRILFRRVRESLGGRLRYMLNGAAPLSPIIQEQLAVMFSVAFLQGYGLTEVTGAAFNSYPEDPTGVVGSPFPSLEFKLRSAPELGYEVSCEGMGISRGELLLRGPSVTSGYFRNPEATHSLFAEGGWLKTGDIVELDHSSGLLRVIDRKKCLFKLAQGEYIAPEKLEAVYGQNCFVEHIFVTGRPVEEVLVAIVVLSSTGLKGDVEVPQLLDDDMAMMSKSNEATSTGIQCEATEAFRSYLLKDFESRARDAKFSGFEKIADIWLTRSCFTVDNDCLTPTQKLRRSHLERRFTKAIDILYERLRKKRNRERF